jgi:hypothetical protein
VIPESLSFLNYDFEAEEFVRGVDDILADAERNLVLRDIWASAYVHPYLFESGAIDASELTRLITGLKDLGYEFIDLDDFAKADATMAFPVIIRE